MIVLLIYIYISIHELSSSQHVLRIPFTEIQDLVGMKLRLESKDLPIFENMAKCEHPCHSYTNESLGMIGCIFAENGPLEGGVESSFSGTGWGA